MPPTSSMRDFPSQESVVKMEVLGSKQFGLLVTPDYLLIPVTQLAR